jgi:hypothetical protein
MAKGRQFKYIKQHRTSFKPVKATRIRNKSSNIKKSEVSIEAVVLSAFIRVLSTICWIIGIAMLIHLLG